MKPPAPGDYARLWFRNLLWVVLTAGLYWPWAQVRSRRFLLRHTRVAGRRLDYHEPPLRLAVRQVLALVLLGGIAAAWRGSPTQGLLATMLALLAIPLLWCHALSERLAHVSWARRRLFFDGALDRAYRAAAVPVLGAGVLAWGGVWLISQWHPGIGLGWLLGC